MRAELEPGMRSHARKMRFRRRGGATVGLAEQMQVRQVPGDGSCLFHSLTVALAYTQNGTHHEMYMKRLKEHSSWWRPETTAATPNHKLPSTSGGSLFAVAVDLSLLLWIYLFCFRFFFPSPSPFQPLGQVSGRQDKQI